MIKVPNDKIKTINLEYLKFYDIVFVNTTPATFYFLHRRYMEQSSDDKNPLTPQSRAVLCEECKSKCAKGKEPPYYSIANGWHLGINMRSLLPRLTVL